jgi:hypothetical protein
MPVIDVLRTMHDMDDGQSLKEALADQHPFVVQALARLLPELGDGSGMVVFDESARQHVFAAVGRCLAQLHELRGMGVVFEDLHWADESTLDLLTHFLAAGVDCPVVGTWRLDDDATPVSHLDWFERTTRSAAVGRLELMPLTEDETGQQLSLLGVDAHAGLAARVHQRTEGRSLFTEQLASTLDDAAELPRMLADLLDRRFAGISETAWWVTRVLGVADRPLTAAQLSAATGLGSAHLVEELHDLRRHRLVRTTPLGAAELQHPLLAEATRRRLVAGEAREVHRVLADVLGAEADASPAEVAAHWEGAADAEREIEWRISAARSAATGFAAAIEAEQWIRALEIWPATRANAGAPPITRAGAYLNAIDALRLSLQFDRAAEMSADAENRLTDIDPTTRAELLRHAADFRGRLEGVDVALALIEEALAAYDSLPVCVGKVHALDRKRFLLQASGRFEESFALAREAAEVASEAGDQRAHRYMLSQVARHEGMTRSVDQALRTMARAAALVPVGSDPRGDIWQAVMLTDMLLLSGSSSTTIDAAGQVGLAVAEQWGIESFPALLVRSNVVLGRIRDGRVAEAADLVDSLSDKPFDLDQWPVYLDRALLDALRGHGDAAVERIAALVAGVPPQTIGADLEFVGEVATVSLWSGAAGDAWARLVPALEQMVDSAPAGITKPAMLLAARAAADVAADDPSSRHRHLETLAALRSRFPSPDADGQRLPPPYDRALSANWQAEMQRLEGVHTVEQWVSAATAWDKLSRPHDSAYCRWRAAQVAVRDGQGTVASRLLKHAAADARQHVPLTEAIATTLAGAR